MILVEQHIIKKTNSAYNELDQLCFLSKNLYNSAVYTIRQHYFNTKKYLNKFQLINEFT
jgi:putative transposase